MNMIKDRFSQLVATMSPRDRWLFMGLVLTVYGSLLGGVWYMGHGLLQDVRSRIDGEEQTLASLSGLDALTSIGGDLNINGNPGLTSLSGLAALTSVVGMLSVSGNSSLCQSQVAVLDARLAATCSSCSGNLSGC